MPKEETSQNPTTLPVNTDSTTKTSTESTTTTSTSTTVKPEPIEQLKIVKKTEWEVAGLTLVAKFKQILPIKKVIVMTTKTEPCSDEVFNDILKLPSQTLSFLKETCMEAIVNLQQESYPDFDDIRENFLIATDGTVYEGRGFSREGEATILEDTKTSFDIQAVSISFMVTEEKQEPNSVQLETFCNFLNRSKSNEEIKENYKVFHQSSLISSNENLIENFEHCEVKWEKSKLQKSFAIIFLFGLFFFLSKAPTTVRRREWNANEFPLENDFYFRRYSSKVIIANADGQNCDSIVIILQVTKKSYFTSCFSGIL